MSRHDVCDPTCRLEHVLSTLIILSKSLFLKKLFPTPNSVPRFYYGLLRAAWYIHVASLDHLIKVRYYDDRTRGKTRFEQFLSTVRVVLVHVRDSITINPSNMLMFGSCR